METFPFSDEELKIPVSKVIEKIRPTLKLDGGDVNVLGIKDACVYVRLQGTCKGCPSSTTTLKNLIEYSLKTEIHPQLRIIHTPQGEINPFERDSESFKSDF